MRTKLHLNAIGLLLLIALGLGLTLWRSAPEPTERTAPEAPQELVSMAPSITETLLVLGAHERIVGVSSFCHLPPSLNQLPRLGGQLDPDLEGILRLQPELVLTLGQHPSLNQELSQLGVASEGIPMDTLPEIKAAFMRLGELAQREEEAQELVRTLDVALERARAHTSDLQSPPRVALIIARTPGEIGGLYAAGVQSYLGQVLQACGAENAFSVSEAWPEISVEALVRAQPDLIIELYPGPERCPEPRALQQMWRDALPGLEAAQSGRVQTICATYAVVPGPGLVQLIEALSERMSSAK